MGVGITSERSEVDLQLKQLSQTSLYLQKLRDREKSYWGGPATLSLKYAMRCVVFCFRIKYINSEKTTTSGQLSHS